MKNEVILSNLQNEIESSPKHELDFNVLVDRFISYVDVSYNSLITYNRALKQFVQYIYDRDIYNPTRQDILDYKNYLLNNNKANTVNLYLASVKNFYKWLEYEGITKDITKNIKFLKTEHRHLKRGLSKEEIQQVIGSCTNLREKTMLILMLSCALRENEVVNIRLEDFYKDGNVTLLRVMGKGKNGVKQDSIKIDDRLLDMIQLYCKEYKIKDYLFTSTSNHNNSGKLNTITVRRIITGLFKKANLNMDRLSTHSTRHSAVEQLLEQGVPIQEVSEFVRHSNINTTMIYSREINQKESKCANLLANELI